MNHIYRLKRSGRTQQLQPVPETARSASKGLGSSHKRLEQLVAGTLGSVALAVASLCAQAQQAPPAALQLPQGGVVSRGSADIQSSTSANQALMTVNQASPRAVIDWTSFNVGSQAKVQFNQPNSSAVVLNQVLGNNASQIYGQISANGQVFLSNPNGIYFSPTAQVNVGGLVATTGRANPDEFMAGQTVFRREGSSASVVNEGQLQAALGGYIALLAPEVRNQGVVVARAGTVALASGEAVTLQFNNGGMGLAGITTTPQAIAALVENRSAVLAEGGQIILSAHALATLQGAVIRNSGQLSATSLVNRGGKVVLMADTIELAGTSQIEANGPSGGGTVLVGGDWQGQGDMRQAIRVTMAPGARIEANATQQGDGGKVVLWSDITRPDSVTRVEGRIEAEGGPQGGDGGQVETSGHVLNVDDIQVSTRAQHGKAGLWLLDPYNITISTGTQTAQMNLSGGVYTTSTNDSILNVVNLQNALANGNVEVSTLGSGLQAGNITISANISWSSANTLKLSATGWIGGSGAIAIGAGGTLIFNQTGSAALGNSSSWYSGAISGAGAFTKEGAGLAMLTGASSYSGTTTISAGTLQIGSGSASASTTSMGSGDIVNNGTLAIAPNAASTITVGGVISGTGSLNITGGATSSSVVLNGDSTFSGGVTLGSNGIVVLGRGTTSTLGALTSGPLGTGTVVANGSSAKIEMAGYNIANALRSGYSSSSTLAPVISNTTPGTAEWQGAIDVTRIAPNSFTLTFSPALGSTIKLTGALSQTSAETPFYKVGSGDVIAQFSSINNRGTVNVSSGGWIMGNSTTSTKTSVTMTGGYVDLAGFDLGTSGDGSSNILTGGVLLNSASLKSTVYAGGATFGNVTVNTPNVGGDIDFSKVSYLYNSSNSVSNTITKTGSGDLRIKSAYTTNTTRLIEWSLNVTSGNVWFDTASTFSGTTSGTHAIASGSFLFFNDVNFQSSAFAGRITGQGAAIAKKNVWLTGASTFSGGLTIDPAATLKLGRAPVYSGTTLVSSPAGTGSITLNSGSTIDLNGFSLANDIAVNGAALITNSVITNVVVAGVISDGATPGQGVTFRSAASSRTLEVSGANTYTGPTTINSNGTSGVVVISNDTALGNSVAGTTITSISTLKLSGGITVNEPITSSGTATIAATLGNLSGDNTITNTLTLATNGIVSSDAGTLTFSPGAGVSNAISGSTFSQTYSGAGNITIAGKISGSGTVNKSGTGTLVLSGDNDFTSAIAHGAGILRAVSNTALGTTANGITVTNGATLELGGPASPNGLAIGAEPLTLSDGGGLRNIAGYNTYAGAMTLSGNATITVDTGTRLNFTSTGSAISVAANKRITFNLTDGDLTIARALSGTTGSSYLKTGSGTLTTGGFTNVTPVTGIYVGLFDPSGSDYSTVYGSTPDLTYAFYTSTSAGTRVTDVNSVTASSLAWTTSVPVAGSAAGTYSLTYSSGVSTTDSRYAILGATVARNWVITPKALTISGLTVASSKVYDGTPTAVTSGTPSLLSAVSFASGSSSDGRPYTGDVVNITGTLTASYNSKDVTAANLVTLGGLTSSNSNYTLNLGSQAATITAKALQVQGLSAPLSKVYDAIRDAVVSGTPSLLSAQAPGDGSVNDGVPYTGDVVTISGVPTGTYNTKDVATANLVTFGGLTSSNSNYILTGSQAATITAKTLTLTGLSVAASRTYDATTGAVVTGTPGLLTAQAPGAGSTSDGLPYTGDVINITGTATGTYNSKDVSLASLVNFGGLTSSNSNYTLAGSQAATITPKALTMTGLTAPSTKVYDGTTNTAASGTPGLLAPQAAGTGSTSDGKPYTGDLINISGTPTAAYNTKDVATANSITFGGLSLDNANYTLIASQAASITPKALTLTGLSVPASRTYDGTRAATVSGTPGVLTAQAPGSGSTSDGTPYTNDPISIAGTATGAYNSKDVSSANLVTFSGLTAGNTNYTLTGSQAATISTAALQISGIVGNNKPYDGTTSATANTSGVVRTGLISGDTVNVSATGTFSTASVGTGKTVTLVSSYSGADVGNYTITGQSTTTANIEPKPLALSIPGATRAYDGTTSILPTGPIGLFGVIGSEDVALSSGNVIGFVDKNVGTNKTVVYTGFTLTGTSAGNYSLPVNPASTANITPLNLQLTGVGAANKVYDASTSATLTGTAVVNPLAGDVVTVNAGAASASFANKNVGAGKAVTVTGYSLTGTDAGNYNLLQPTGLTANISPASLQVTGLGAADKVYDASTTATLTGTAAVAPLGSDVLSLVGTGTGAFADKNAGTGKAVTVSGYSLSGADAGNYTLVQPTGLTANISRADLAVTGVGVANKVYDATTAAPLTGTPTVTALAGDVVQVTGAGAGAFADKNVGTGKAVTVSGFTLGGTDAGNYNPVQPTGLTADITPAALQISGLTVSNRAYDGTTGATVNTAGAIKTGLRGTDDVTVSATGSFADPHAGTNKTVTLSSSYGGVDVGNYTITDQPTAQATIAPKPLGLNIPGATRVYDGSTNINVSGAVTLSGVVGSDDVSLSSGNVTGFVDKNVGTGKPVVYTGFTLSGTAVGNYTLPASPTSTADITPAPLSVSGITGVNKVYDGTATASANVSGAVFSGLLGSDTVLVSATGTFRNGGNTADDKNVGTAKTVALSGSYSGADAGNYTISIQATTTADITPKALTISGSAITSKPYDGNTTAVVTVGSLGGLVSGETLTVSGSGSFGSKDVGTYSINTAYTLADGSGGLASNYSLANQNLSASITPKPLTITGSSVASKVYDGNTTAVVTAGSLGGLVSGETLTVSGAGAFGAKDVGTYTINTAYTLSDGSGGLASNYSLANQNLSASITPKALTISGITASHKTYDGMTGALVSTAGVVKAGLIGGDVVTVSAMGVFADKHVGTGKTVNLTSSYGGTDVGNYTITDQASTTANITPAALTISGITAASKAYDGTTAATVSTAGVVKAGLMSGDVVTVSSSGVFADKNAGTGKAVNLTSSYGGADFGNYTITDQASTVADITPKALTISGITAANKTYDGTTAASVSTAGMARTGLVVGDVVNVAVTGAFADKNAADGKTVNLTSSYSGADVGNYTIAGQASTVANITPAALTISGITAAGKTYDGLTDAQVSTAGVVKTGLIGGDVVTVSATGVFADKNAGPGKTVNLSSSYGGSDFGNYTITSQASTTATISPAALTMTAQNAFKLIGQADPTFTATYSGFVNGETAAVLTGAGVVRTGTDTAANTYTGVLVPTASSNNYTITPVNGNFTIVPADTLLVTLGNASKVYGANVSGLTATSAQYITGGNVLRTVTLTPGANGSYTYSDGLGTSGSFTLATLANSTSGVGNYGITLTNFVKNGTNFNSQVTQDGNLLVNPLAVSLGAVSPSKVYDGNTAVQTTVAVANRVGADDVAVLGVGNFTDNKNVGNTHTYSLSAQLTGVAAGNYYLSSGTLTGSNGVITPAALTISGITAASKTYDGTATAGLNLAGLVRSGLIGSDEVTVSATGRFRNAGNTADDKNVGNSKTVQLTSSYGGADVGNYTITGQDSTTASITPAALTISGITAASKTYDGTTAASVSTAGMLRSGLVAGDVVNVAVTGAFADKNAGNNKLVSLSSSYSGADVGNYTIVGQGSALANITPAALTISGITAAGKVYDGLTDAQVSTAGVVKTGLLVGDVVTVSATGVFADKNAGPGKTVNLSSSYGGADFGNYTISSQASTTATITPAALTMTAQNAFKLIGQADPAFTAIYSGFVNGETAAVLTGAGVVRTGNDTAADTYTGVLVPTGSSNNYAITANPGNFTIVPADTLLVTLGNASKAYGASVPSLTVSSAQYLTSGNVLRNVSLTPGANGSYTYSDGLGTTGSFTLSTAASSTSGVGNYAITLGNFIKNGSNFTSQVTQDANLQINQLAVTLGSVVPTKTYDGNTAVQTTVAVANRVGADDVAVRGVGNFTDNKNVGNTHTYSLSAQLTGAAAGNYYLNSSTLTGSNGVITPATLTISGITAASKTYDGTATASLNLAGLVRTGLIGSDEVTVHATGLFADANVASGKTVTLTSTYGGADAGNYTITGQANTTAGITPKALALSGSRVANKVYDGTTTAVLTPGTLTGLVGTQTLAVTGSAAFASKNVGTQTLAASYTLANAGSGATAGLASNYTLAGETLLASITPKALTVSGITAADKTYDGTTAASVSVSSVVRTGLVAGDAVQVTATGSFADPNAGPGKTVHLVSSYSGADVGNYSISSQATTLASITPATLQVVAEDATKVQDNQPFAGGNGVRFNGFVNNESSAVLGGTLAYGGSAQGAVNPGSYAITPMGLSSSNYQLVFQDGALTIRPQAASGDAISAALIQQALSKSDLPSTGSALPRAAAAAFEPAGQDRAAASTPPGRYAWPAIEAVKLAEALDAGLLGVTILRPQGAATAAVMFEQDQDTISIRSAAAPLKNPVSDKVVFSSRMIEFMVEDGNGQLVEFQGGIVNRRMVVVAPSAESKQLAQRSMNTVLAGAIMALGRQTPVLLAKLDSVVLDLR